MFTNHQILTYDKPSLKTFERGSIFFAGPSPSCTEHTAWRLEAEAISNDLKFCGLIIKPEYASGGFRREPFDDGKPAVTPGMKRASEKILQWETDCIDHADVLLVHMPFSLGAETDPNSLPGFSTRAEAARAIARNRFNLVLIIPNGSLASGQLRFHAHQRGIPVYKTLREGMEVAVKLATQSRGDRFLRRLSHGLRGLLPIRPLH